MSSAILQGLRVVEASAFVAAPLGGMTLAQLGAEVIRIDPPGGGLDYRRWPVTPDNQSLFWAGLNKAKRSVTIDIASPEGRELAMALVTAPGEDAGILLTNFPARGWLDPVVLRKLRPDLIQLVIQGDRHGGSAVDYTVNPSIGLPFITGPNGGSDPVNHVLPAWDLVTGQMAAVGILAAERHRRRTGQGQDIKLALEDVALAVLGHLGFLAEAEAGVERPRYGNYLFGAFGRDFVCADGERIMIVGLTPKQWKGLCEATGLGAAMQNLASKLGLNFRLEGDRFKAREEIAAAIETWVSARSLSDITAAFDAQGVCWNRYQTVRQLVAGTSSCSPENPMFSHQVQPGIGRTLVPGLPLEFGSHARQPSGVAPVLGADTEAVLSEVLGISAAEYGRLHDRGVVAGPNPS